MNLFEINNEIQKCIVIDETVIDGETGEVLDADYLDQLEMAKDKKVENIAKWIKNLESDIEQLKKQKEIFDTRKRQAENRRDSLKNYLAAVLDGEKWDRAEDKAVTISWRRSEAVNVTDPGQIPEAFLIAQPPKIDKTGLKVNLKNGVEIPGAELETKNNIQIK